MIEELNASGTVKATNVWGNELLFRNDASSGKGGFYSYNSHGDVVKVTSPAGAVLNSYEYDTWGNVLNQTEGMNNPFKYAGEMYDAETRFYYLRARYYDPSVGRFVTEDTYQGQVDNPLSLNRYAYTHNNPIRYTDPSGMCIWDGCVAEGVAVAYVAAAVATLATVALGIETGKAISTATEEEQGKDYDVEVVVDANKYPESAKHIEDAQKSGQPATLTINRDKAKANRKESLSGKEKVKEKDLDEYPPAMFEEGGKNASVRPISSSDNRGSGATLGNKLRSYPNGTKVKITVQRGAGVVNIQQNVTTTNQKPQNRATPFKLKQLE